MRALPAATAGGGARPGVVDAPKTTVVRDLTGPKDLEMKPLAAFALVVLAVGLHTTTALAQTTPLALAQQWAAAQNRGDVAGTLALLADDAVLDGVGNCTPNACQTRAAIQAELERRVAASTQVNFTGYQVVGTTVAARNEVSNDTIRAAGVQRVINYQVFEVQGGRIAAVRVRWDLSDEQTARHGPAVAAVQVWGPFRPLASLPRTGAGDLATRYWTGIAASVLLLGGGALRGCLAARRATD